MGVIKSKRPKILYSRVGNGAAVSTEPNALHNGVSIQRFRTFVHLLKNIQGIGILGIQINN